MKLRFHTVEGESQEIDAQNVREVIPYQGVFTSPFIKKPYEGAVAYKGEILPVIGPMAYLWNPAGPFEERPWLLIFKDHAQVIEGLPEVMETKSERSNLEAEILQLEKDLAA